MKPKKSACSSCNRGKIARGAKPRINKKLTQLKKAQNKPGVIKFL